MLARLLSDIVRKEITSDEYRENIRDDVFATFRNLIEIRNREIYKSAVARIIDFQAGMGAFEVVGVRIPGFDIPAFELESLEYKDSHLVVFCGLSRTFIQNVSEIEFMLEPLASVFHKPARLSVDKTNSNIISKDH